jgi:multimeric flavodoxin WrbA
VKILAIVGSPRLRGNTNYLVDKALNTAAGLGAETEKIVLRRYKVNPCIACKNCGELKTCLLKDDGTSILEKLAEADGIILATPVYFHNVSAQMKALIDRCHFFYSHARKPKAQTLGLIVVAGEYGIEETLHALCRFNEITFGIPEERIFSVSGLALEPGEVKSYLPLIEAARQLGQKMVGVLEKR